MSDSPEQPGTPAEEPTSPPQTAAPAASAPAPAAPAWTPPAAPQDPPAADRATDGTGPAALAAERPEIAVGAAFAGGLVFALILKRLAR